MIIPIFTSHYSIGRSILTLDDPEEIQETNPVSIFSISKTHNINPIYLVENSLNGFIQAYKKSSNNNISLRFGLKLIICHDMNNKPEKIETQDETGSKIIIFLKNSDAYYDIIKIYSFAATTGLYKGIPRIDWGNLNKMFTKNLILAIPFYDSFIYINQMECGQCLPMFKQEALFFIENHGLPFDGLIKDHVVAYCKLNKHEMINTHQIYYYKDKDINAYQTYRIITARKEFSKTTVSRPELEHFGSDQFSFESYGRLIKI